MIEVELIYVGHDHYQRTERDLDDSPAGSSYWSCYIPSVIIKSMGIEPVEHRLYILTLEPKEVE